MPDTSFDDVIATHQIRETLARYCRALDRMDKEMAYGVWSDGATAHYLGIYDGTARGFVDWVWEAHAGMQCHSHQVTNLLAQIDGESATSESYVTVVLWTKSDDRGQQTEIVARGRYLDRWSRGPRGWTIDERTHVVDTQTVAPLRKGQISAESARDASDPSFEFITRG